MAQFPKPGPSGPAGPEGPGGTGPAGPEGPIGPQGVQGVPGPPGADGAQGPRGPQGDPGAAGPAGVDGADGATFAWAGSWDNTKTYAHDDVTSASDGSAYISLQDDNTGHDPTADNPAAPVWWSIFAIHGPQGPVGPAGAAGPTGPEGPQGIDGPAGADGAQGPEGPQGNIGPAGADGAPGAAGPAGADGAPGPAGADGAPGPQGIQGVKGDKGDTGAAGAPGADGAPGPQGIQGVRGSDWYVYNGAGVPPTGTFAGEQNGDLAVREADGEVFLRVAGAWVDQHFTIQGPAGGSGAAAPAPSRAYRNAALNTAANAWVKVPVDTITFDTGGYVDMVNHRWVAPANGYYRVSGEVNATPTAANQRIVAGIWKNGALYTQGSEGDDPSSTLGLGSVVTDVVFCNAGDYLELQVYSNAVLALFTSPAVNYLTVSAIGATAAYPNAQTPTQAMAYRNAAYNIGAGMAKVPMDATQLDPGANIDVANGWYLCPVTGTYLVIGEMLANQAAGVSIETAIFKNGALACIGNNILGGTGTAGSVVAGLVSCQAGDKLELWASASAASPATVASAARNFLHVVQVGGANVIAALSPTAQAADYNVQPGQQVLMTGAHNANLPPTPQDGTTVGVVALNAGAAGAVPVNRSGATDTITIGSQAGQTTFSLLSGQSALLVYLAGVWYVTNLDSFWGDLSLVSSPAAPYSAKPGQRIVLDSSFAGTVNLPPAPPSGSRVQVVRYDALTAATVTRGGTDTIRIAGDIGLTTLPVAGYQTLDLTYWAGTWYGVWLSGSSMDLQTGAAGVTGTANSRLELNGTGAVTLPSSPPNGSEVDVVQTAPGAFTTVNRAGTNTISCFSGTGATSVKFSGAMGAKFQYKSGIWYQVSGPVPVTPTPWTNGTYQNAWTTVAGATAAAYMKDANGMVHMRGRVTGGASGSSAFVVPAGFRPGGTNDDYPAAGWTGAAPGAAMVGVSPTTGDVFVYFAAGVTDVSLVGVHFLAEN